MVNQKKKSSIHPLFSRSKILIIILLISTKFKLEVKHIFLNHRKKTEFVSDSGTPYHQNLEFSFIRIYQLFQFG